MGGLNGSAFHAPDMEYHSCWGGPGERIYRNGAAITLVHYRKYGIRKTRKPT